MTQATLRISKRIVWLSLLLMAVCSMLATSAEPERWQLPQARLHARIYGHGPLGPKQDGDYVEVEILLRGDAIRVNFVGANQSDAWLLNTGSRGNGKLVSESGDYVLPVADASGPYWYDPEQPCIDIGGRCTPVAGEFIANRLAAGWRYERASRGPDGTRSGTLWIDVESGLLLGYRSRAGAHARELRVTDVSFEPVAAAVFQLPDNLREAGQPAVR